MDKPVDKWGFCKAHRIHRCLECEHDKLTAELQAWIDRQEVLRTAYDGPKHYHAMTSGLEAPDYS